MVKNSILQLLAPLISVFIFVLGSGFLTTLLAIRLYYEGSNSITIGFMTTAFYLGYVISSFKREKFIHRVGHIRAFATFASALTIISLLHGVFMYDWLWFILRFTAGMMTAGIFIVIESWFLGVSDPKMRGKIVAVYMMVFFLAQGLGQFFMNVGDPKNLILFCIVAMSSSLAIIPLAIAYVDYPKYEMPSTLRFKKLFNITPTGVFGAVCAGLLIGAIYGLFPLFIIQSTQEQASVSAIMAATIFGAMLLQYPIGKLSDREERRHILIILASCVILMSLLIFLLHSYYWLFMASVFLFGGFVFTIYPVSISHACDKLKSTEIVNGTQGLLLSYSIGATTGPLIVPLFMRLMGPNGLLVYFVSVSTLLITFIGFHLRKTPEIKQEEKFVPLSETTPVLSTIDPRSNDEIDTTL